MGVRGIKLKDGDHVVSLSVLTNDGVRFLIQLITPTLNFINYILFLLIMGAILVFFSWKISLSILFLVSFCKLVENHENIVRTITHV